MSLIVLYFLHSISVLSFYIDVVLTLSIKWQKIDTNIIITGDFEIDLLQMNERAKFQKYFDLLVTNGLFPLITLPIRTSKKKLYSNRSNVF